MSILLVTRGEEVKLNVTTILHIRGGEDHRNLER